MATNTNTVTLSGRLGADPEMRYFESGSVLVTFSLAVNRWNGKEETTDWHNIKAFGKTAENISNWLSKGNKVTITGSLEIESWEDKNGGGKRTKMVIICRAFENHTPKPTDSAPSSSSGGFGPLNPGVNESRNDIPF